MTSRSAARLQAAVRSADEPLVARLCGVAHVSSLVVAAVFLVWINRNQWFFGDEWDFLVGRGVLGGQHHLFHPHNEHWSTVPILIYRGLFTAFGVRTYVPYVIVLVSFHLVTVHLLWRVLRRIGASAPVALALATLFGLYGAGFENLLWAFQIGFVGSVALGLATVLLVDHPAPSPRREAAAVALTVLGLTFSGVTLTMTAVAAVVLLLRRGLAAAARYVAVPAVVYLGWYALFGRKAVAQSPIDIDSLLALPRYAAEGVFGAFEAPTGMRGVGPVLALGLAAWLLHQRQETAGRGAPAAALAAGVLFLFLSTGIARSGLGVEQATSSRYVYLGGALVLPAVGLALSRAAAGRWLATGFVVFIVGLATVHGVGTLRSLSRAEGDRETSIKRRLLASAELVRAGAPLVAELPEPTFSPDLDVNGLRQLVAGGELPREERLATFDRLGAAVALQVAVSAVGASVEVDQAMRPMLVSVGDATVHDAGADCVSVVPTGGTPQLVLDVRGPSAFVLTPSRPGALHVFLRPPRPTSELGSGRAFPVVAEAVRVVITASPTSPLINVPPIGVTTICGLDR